MQWKFDNSYTLLPTGLFTKVLPAKFPSVALVKFNNALAVELGLDFNGVSDEKLSAFFSGAEMIPGSEAISQAYAGHQFGHFNVLGDGRAILLGEHLTTQNFRYDIQLKGAGITPYSRRGDGKASLSAMLREYVISEAMNGLNIPTSRSLAVVSTGENVYRENMPKGAILTRIASSHIRVGTFEYVSRYESKETLQIFTNYVIERHYPEIINKENPALALLEVVMKTQIDLVVNWLRVGFIHGVMNTDNTSIAGETFDYGPCAFMNAYHPNTVFSSIDSGGRYAFGNQPSIIQWNITRFAETLLPIIHDNQEVAIKLATEVLKNFAEYYNETWFNMMCNKLGINYPQKNDTILIQELLDWMLQNNADYTNTFLVIQNEQIPQNQIYQSEAFQNWLKKWEERIFESGLTINAAQELMSKHNPKYIPRNYLVEEALIEASEMDDFTKFEEL